MTSHLKGRHVVIYTVKPGDTLSAIAQRYGIRSWQDLYHDPANASFRAKRMNPDLIFPGDQICIPLTRPAAAIGQLKPPAALAPGAKPTPQTYIGLGAKGGGFVAVAGYQALEAKLYSVENYDDTFYLNGGILTAGLGIGAGVNVQLVICLGGTKPADFQGVKFDGWDFNVSLGGRWGDVVRSTKNIPALLKIAKALKDAKLGATVLKGLLKLSPKEWEQLSNLAKTIRDRLSLDPEAQKPQVNSFDIPLAGVALEVDVYRYWGTVKSIN